MLCWGGMIERFTTLVELVLHKRCRSILSGPPMRLDVLSTSSPRPVILRGTKIFN